MDFWVVYNAFLLNVPLPQEYFDHTGYLSILLLSYWLRALHGLGIVHVISLTALPPVSDAAGQDSFQAGAGEAAPADPPNASDTSIANADRTRDIDRSVGRVVVNEDQLQIDIFQRCAQLVE